MSIVAVKKYKDKIVIGADSQTTSGNLADRKDISKLDRIDKDLVIGHTGLAADFTLLKMFLRGRKIKGNTEDSILEVLLEFHKFAVGYFKAGEYAPDTSAYIFVYRGKIFFTQGYYIKQIKGFYAAGCGRDFALTALELGADVKKAIQVACKYDTSCGLPTKIMIINKNR